jgi:hypothetical protein
MINENIHEKSKPMIIPKPNKNQNNNETSSFRNITGTTHQLSKSCFDPTNGSPPNMFMEKLQYRIRLYSSSSSSIKN